VEHEVAALGKLQVAPDLVSSALGRLQVAPDLVSSVLGKLQVAPDLVSCYVTALGRLLVGNQWIRCTACSCLACSSSDPRNQCCTPNLQVQGFLLEPEVREPVNVSGYEM